MKGLEGVTSSRRTAASAGPSLCSVYRCCSTVTGSDSKVRYITSREDMKRGTLPPHSLAQPPSFYAVVSFSLRLAVQ
eukprot:scaffold39902_cov30-Phaeocystis_antarctica.AAC.1